MELETGWREEGYLGTGGEWLLDRIHDWDWGLTVASRVEDR